MRIRVFLCCAALATSGLMCAQEQVQVQRQVQRIGSADTRDAKPKPLTKEQELQVRQLLESAESGTAALDAGSRIVSYTELARAYQVRDKKKSVELLESALNATRDLQLESADRRLNDQLKQQLERRVVRDFATLAPQRLDQLMDQLPGEVRAMALEPMITYYGKANRLSRATELVMQVAQESEMPYGSATELMSLLGRERPDEIRSLFLASLASYQAHDHNGFRSAGDFLDMIAKFQDQLPPSVLQQAIDEVLSQARKTDEKFGSMNISLASAKGAARFESAYDYRLWQLMPVLRRIDPERADKLLQDQQDVSTLATKYPDGVNSLNAGDGQNGNMSMMISMGDGPRGAPEPPGPSVLERQRMAQITADAQKHPQDAIASAATLSPPVAVEAYIEIARAAQKDNPSSSRAALDKAAGLVEKLPLNEQMISMQRIVNLYLQLGETDKAKDALEQALSVANRLYKKDTNGDDPNTAPKAYWASTNGYRSIMASAEKIDPAWAVTLLKDIPDEGVRVFNQIAMANAIAGSPSSGFQIISAFKNGGTNMTMISEEN